MAQSVHLWLEIDGRHVEGEFRRSGPGREGSIECFSFYYEVAVPAVVSEASDRFVQPTELRLHEPVRFHKRINKSTPPLLKALRLQEPVTKAEFRFFRRDPTGTRSDQHYFTVELQGGFVRQVKQVSEEATMAGRSDAQAIEEVSLTFEEITWRDIIAGHEYHLSIH